MVVSRFHTLAPQLRTLVAPRDRQAADRELLRRFSAEGDEDAFAEIVRRHGPMLLRACRRVSPNGHDAEDISQAAFLLLARKAASGGWHDSVAGWLYQTAYRLARKARVAAGRRARHEARVRLADPPGPDDELTVREFQAALDEELSQLPEKYRAPIVLCCLEGRSPDEAAGYLGWPLGAVKDGLERGRERLRARLARRGVVLGTALTSAWLLEGAAKAALPPHATARAALLIASGQAKLADLLPTPVAALTKGVTTTMLLCRMTILASALALACGAASGLSRPKDAPPARPAQPPEAKPAPDDTGPVRPEPMFLTGHRGAVNAVAFAPDGKLAAAGADGTVRVWDLSSGAQLQKLDQGGNAAAVAFSPDGRMLAAASAGKAGTLTTWDAATGRRCGGPPAGRGCLLARRQAAGDGHR
ncbi:MAG: sigma-70 family RNA polymerase sigma factor [Gemmataceae bacterium]